jgi:hypothetical protein
MTDKNELELAKESIRRVSESLGCDIEGITLAEKIHALGGMYAGAEAALHRLESLRDDDE